MPKVIITIYFLEFYIMININPKAVCGNLFSKYYEILECSEELAEENLCCDGYLSVGTLDLNFEPSSYYETNWPSQFFAQVIDIKNRGHTCCFILKSADDSKTITVSETLELYEFEAEKPVHDIERCICGIMPI